MYWRIKSICLFVIVEVAISQGAKFDSVAILS